MLVGKASGVGPMMVDIGYLGREGLVWEKGFRLGLFYSKSHDELELDPQICGDLRISGNLGDIRL